MNLFGRPGRIDMDRSDGFRMQWKRDGGIALWGALLGMIWISACAVVAAGGAGAGGTYGYFRGELKQTLEAKYDDVWNASQKAVQDLELHLEESSKDAMSARLMGFLANGDRYVIRMESEKRGFVTVVIRIGTLGDKEKSEKILDAIMKNLPGKPAPHAVNGTGKGSKGSGARTG